MTNVDPARLQRFCRQALAVYGVPESDAALVAESLVQADLWGHQSHGVMRLPWYTARLESGAMRAVTQIERATDAGAIAVLDANDGMGQVAAAEAAREAINRAKQHGVGVAAVRNSGHFGTAMFFTLMAAREGCIGILTTNASPSMAPWGGRTKALGNNPWSIAAPAGRYAPFVLDIANTAVARGKIYLAKQKGTLIPEGWAIDRAGRPTVDPAAAILGNILPMAGHKGYAISVMMDVLSGVLSGSGFLSAVTGPYQTHNRSRCGHLYVGLHIEAFRPLAQFETDMEIMVNELKHVPLAEGQDAILYPGEREALADANNRKSGLLLPGDTLGDLVRLAEKHQLMPELPFVPNT
jgi:LDH2 family malate/lactate/ureidoglycolate dehydrogenase